MGEDVVGFQIAVVPLELELDPDEELDVPVPELVAPELLDVALVVPVAPPVPDPEEEDDDASAPVPAPPEPGCAPDDPHAAPSTSIAPVTRRRVTDEARAGEGQGSMALLSRRSPAPVHAEHPHGHFPPGVISTSTLSAPGFASTVRIEAHGAEVIHAFVAVVV
jgi:hypothetical protein